MARIVSKTLLAPNIFEFIVRVPRLAAKALPGHFVIVMADEVGERIPLTVADFDRVAGTITLVLMVVGTSSTKFSKLGEGDELYAIIGPLGHASQIDEMDTVVMVAGGVGTAPIYPIARAMHERGNRVISIQGARTEELLFWKDKLAAVSDEHILMTDDGSLGRKGLVTEPLRELVEGQEIVFHLVAAMGGASGDPEVAQALNVAAGEHLVRGAAEAGAERFVQVSSMAVYGAPDRELLVRRGVRLVAGDAVRGDPDGAARDVLDALADRDGLVVHFDVDVVDSTELPLAQFPHFNQGLSLADALRILADLTAAPDVAAVVVTETNVDNDPEGIHVRRLVGGIADALVGALGASAR